ncbi:MAG: hypothetical protein M5U33_12525 [Pseudorhodoplanes sp.]|nr:hypothetical protein [Pseudorhodoplanes sp.]
MRRKRDHQLRFGFPAEIVRGRARRRQAFGDGGVRCAQISEERDIQTRQSVAAVEIGELNPEREFKLARAARHVPFIQ